MNSRRDTPTVADALTDSEWMSLIRSDDDSELPVCCSNISALRDAIITVASERMDMFGMGATGLLRAYGAAREGHDLENIEPLEKLMQSIDVHGQLKRSDLPKSHRDDPEAIEFRDGLTREELVSAQQLVERLERLIKSQRPHGQDEKGVCRCCGLNGWAFANMVEDLQRQLAAKQAASG